MNKITVKIGEPQKISVKFGQITVESGDAPPYSGSYKVVSKAFEPTKMPTRGRVMTDDVTVLEIPYFEVSNENGNTVYIGGESEVL